MTHAHVSPRPSADGRRRARPFVLPMLAWLLSAAAASPLLLAADAKPADRAADAAAAKGDALNNDPAQWMRFTEKDGTGKLEVGVGTYKNDAGVTVHLVGAVHVGDKAYYEGLNKDFEKYDALLYEMVKPAGAGAPQKGQGGSGMVGMIQKLMKDVLELDYQLDGIDYTKKNFVHADLDAEAFAKLQEERGESILGLMVQQMLKDLAKGFDPKAAGDKEPAKGPGLMELFDILNSPDRAKELKLMMGRSMASMEEQANAFQGTVLVTERNKKAIEVLREAVKNGHKEIGVFYGAAHMPDLEARLGVMGFKRTGMEYKVAWDIVGKDKAGEKPAAPKKKPEIKT